MRLMPDKVLRLWLLRFPCSPFFDESLHYLITIRRTIHRRATDVESEAMSAQTAYSIAEGKLINATTMRSQGARLIATSCSMGGEAVNIRSDITGNARGRKKETLTTRSMSLVAVALTIAAATVKDDLIKIRLRGSPLVSWLTPSFPSG